MNLMNGALSPQTMLSLLIFLAVGTLAFAAMVGLRSREAVRRRAPRALASTPVTSRAAHASLRYSGLRAAQKLVDYAAKHYSSSDTKDVKVLRQRLPPRRHLRSARHCGYSSSPAIGAGARVRRDGVLHDADVSALKASRCSGFMC